MVYIGTNCENGVLTASNFGAVITSIRKGKIPFFLIAIRKGKIPSFKFPFEEVV